MFEEPRARLKALAKSGKRVLTSAQSLMDNQQKLATTLAKLTPVKKALNRDLARWQRRTAPHLEKLQQLADRLNQQK